MLKHTLCLKIHFSCEKEYFMAQEIGCEVRGMGTNCHECHVLCVHIKLKQRRKKNTALCISNGVDFIS